MNRYLESGETPAPASSNPDLAQLGEHVASVLAAAESAAERLRAEARDEAERVRREATEAAAALRAQAADEVETSRAQLRREATAAAEEAQTVRQDADAYAKTKRREADAEAVRIVDEADYRAANLSTAAADRNRELLDGIAASEARMHTLAESLREVAKRLDEVAGAGDLSGRADAGARDAGGKRVLDETLVARVADDAR